LTGQGRRHLLFAGIPVLLKAMLQEEQEKTDAQAEMFANRLGKRLRHLAKWAKRTRTGAFRLYDRDIPEIPLALDFFAGQEGDALAGALYKRPYEKDEAEEERWLLAMQEAAAKATGVAAQHIFVKQRERQRSLSHYGKLDNKRVMRTVSEGGLKFRVNLSDYLDTGLFLDRRLLRAMVQKEAAGKRLLNLFSYTGSFSVYAAAGGAAQTVSVDLSNTYLDRAAENFTLNGFTGKTINQEDFFAGTNGGNLLVRADVLSFLDRAARAKKTWDRIVLDPPAFSNSKKMRGFLDLRRDYRELLSACLCLLAPGGKLGVSANMRGFHPGAAELESALAPQYRGLAVTGITDKTVDEDFRGRKTPLTFLLQRPLSGV
jgi:23S rRNA G2069 N7-methylase RlmK/C1962 C5-methylase RlmI